MAQRTLTITEKEYIRTRLIKGALFYKKYLLDKLFLIVTDDYQIETVTFTEHDFPHLTGIKSNIRNCDFLDYCSSGKLKRANINSNQRHNVNHLLGKANLIENIQRFLHADTNANLFLMGVTTNTTTFPCAIRNDNLQITILFKGSNRHARSARKEATPPKHYYSKRIIGVFEMHDNRADKIIYIKNGKQIVNNIHDSHDLFSQRLLSKLSNDNN